MPGTRCKVALCDNSLVKTRTSGNVIYHKFPKDEKLRAVWVNNCKRLGKWNPSTSHVCSDHFDDDDYERDLQNELFGLPARKKLKPTAVPQVNIGKPPVKESSIKRAERARRRSERKEILKPLMETNVTHEKNDVNVTEDEKQSNAKESNRSELEDKVKALQLELDGTWKQLRQKTAEETQEQVSDEISYILVVGSAWPEEDKEECDDFTTGEQRFSETNEIKELHTRTKSS